VKIIEHNWKWRTGLSKRNGDPPFIVVHNQGGEGTTEAIHLYHRDNPKLLYQGIAYHYHVRLNGDVHRGRPEWAMGGHCLGWNHCIGVCFEGNYDTRKTMPDAQMEAGLGLVGYLRSKYKVAVKGHREMPGNATSCPGKYFPLQKIKDAGAQKPVDIVKLKKAMLAYAKAATPPITVPDGFRTDNDWKEPARTLAWRVSGRVHETDNSVPQSAQPTPELAQALTR